MEIFLYIFSACLKRDGRYLGRDFPLDRMLFWLRMPKGIASKKKVQPTHCNVFIRYHDITEDNAAFLNIIVAVLLLLLDYNGIINIVVTVIIMKIIL